MIKKTFFIKKYFMRIRSDYKYHSLMMNPYFEQASTKEKIFAFIILFTVLCSLIFRIKLLFIFGMIGVCAGLSVQSYRGIKNSAACYRYYVKPQILKNDSPIFIVTRSTGTIAAVMIKYGQPIIKICGLCFGAGMGTVAIYDYSFGFNPLGEVALAYSKKQTWSQASHHLLNPIEYHDMVKEGYAPYLQDIKKNDPTRFEKIMELKQELKKHLDELSKK